MTFHHQEEDKSAYETMEMIKMKIKKSFEMNQNQRKRIKKKKMEKWFEYKITNMKETLIRWMNDSQHQGYIFILGKWDQIDYECIQYVIVILMWC